MEFEFVQSDSRQTAIRRRHRTWPHRCRQRSSDSDWCYHVPTANKLLAWQNTFEVCANSTASETVIIVSRLQLSPRTNGLTSISTYKQRYIKFLFYSVETVDYRASRVYKTLRICVEWNWGGQMITRTDYRQPYVSISTLANNIMGPKMRSKKRGPSDPKQKDTILWPRPQDCQRCMLQQFCIDVSEPC